MKGRNKMLFYDFEVYPHDWLVVIMNTDDKSTNVIVNDRDKLIQLYNSHINNIWCGYNSRSYDQYILKSILLDFNPKEVNDWIIKDHKPAWQYSSLFNKIQLFNYDVMTDRGHSLKQLEGFLGNNIKETSVPFDIDRKLTAAEIQETIKYCTSDVMNTINVFIQRKEEFTSQMSLIKTFNLPLQYIGKTKPQLSAIILGASRREYNDEFDITIPDTLKIKKYQYIVDWYKNPENRNYEKSLETEVAGVPHIFAWGGVHGAIEKYSGKGLFINCDVASLYPSIMIEYGYLSRNVSQPQKYAEIKRTRLKLKKEKNPMQAPYKIVLNSTYGAMKDKYNQLYDPLMANNVCITGQLLLLDLIEHIEPYCKLIQSNTDGLFLKVNSEDDIKIIQGVAHEWEIRTRLNLEWDTFSKIFQKDVNNYVVIHEDGSYKSKGAYVKKLSTLDNDLPIVNRSLIDYFTKGIPVQETINNCNDLLQFQKVVKASSKYKCAMYGNTILNERCLRVFASRSRNDKGVYKLKSEDKNPEKFAGTPERCFILNGDIKGKRIPRKLDRDWYIKVAKKRLKDFTGIEDQINMWELI
jgi:WD40 repeat protein